MAEEVMQAHQLIVKSQRMIEEARKLLDLLKLATGPEKARLADQVAYLLGEAKSLAELSTQVAEGESRSPVKKRAKK